MNPATRRLAAVVGALVVVASTLAVDATGAQEYAYDSPWVQPPPRGAPPSARVNARMAYHPPSAKLVMFGGRARTATLGSTDLADTWTWDGTTWTLVNAPASPPGRATSGLAYHAATGELVFFGCTPGQPQVPRETWTWDGQQWERAESSLTRPCPSAVSMAGHQRSGRVVLFGSVGTEQAGYTPVTWTWDGTTWHEERPSTSPRFAVAMAEHGPDRVVVFGGSVPNFGDVDETWTWDGSDWTHHRPSKSPSARTGTAMSFLPRTDEVVLFGGHSQAARSSDPITEGRLDDTWTWDGATWLKRAPEVSPSRRSLHSMAYGGGASVVLFGGQVGRESDTSETWTWDADTSPVGANPSSRVVLSLDPSSLPADGVSTSRATVTVSVGTRGFPGAAVHLSSGDPDVRIGTVRDHNNGTYTATVTASFTPGTAKLTAVARNQVGAEMGRDSANLILTESETRCGPRHVTDTPPESARWSDLDPSFGCRGKIASTLRTSSHHQDNMVVQEDDKILLFGEGHLYRINADGTVDDQFGTNGVVAVSDRDGPLLSTNVALDRDGAIVVLGHRIPPGSETYAGYVVRYTKDGLPDGSFAGGSGRIVLTKPAWKLLVEDDGDVVTLGTAEVRSSVTGNGFADSTYYLVTRSAGRAVVARYDPMGRPDSGFGDQGDGSLTFTYSSQGFTVPADLGSLEGTILVAGSQCQSLGATFPHCQMALARLTDAGRFDAEFNPCATSPPPCGGVVVTPFEAAGNAATGAHVTATSLVVQPDRKIIVAGGGGGSDGVGFAMARYNVDVAGHPDGSLDATFNPCTASPPPCGGKVVRPTHFGGYEPRDSPPFGPADGGHGMDVDLQDDGRIIVAGYGPSTRADFLVARYLPDGALDTCNSTGYVRTRFGFDAGASNVAVQSNGRIVAGGAYKLKLTGTSFFGLAGYHGGGGLGSRSLSVMGPAPVAEPTSGTAAAGFTVSLDALACEETKVDVATEQGSATPGQDYTPVSTTVSFGPGEQTKPVEVPVLSDDLPEHDEDFSLRLSNPRTAASEGPQGLVGPASEVSLATPVAPATILDSGGVVGIGDVAVTEPDAASVPAHFTVTLSGPAVAPVTVRYATSDASATAGADYQTTSGTLTIPTGATTATVTVPVTGDTEPEPTERFTVELSDPGGARLGRAKGTGTILDAGPGIAVGDATVVEGNAGTTPARFTVTLNAAPTQAVSVDYATAHQSAGAADYRAISGTLDFAPGQRSQVLTVEVVADTLDEDDEAFTLSLSKPSGAALHRATGTGTILDDDEPPPPAPGPPPPSPSVADLGPTAPGLAAPAGSTPPPAPLTQAQAQGQSQAQAQQQLQQQAQQQAQGQAQTQAQLQQQAQLQAQAQAQLQPGLMLDRERELQLEKARTGAGGRTTLAASARRQTVPATAMFVWAAALGAFVAALAGRHHSAEAAHLARSGTDGRGTRRSLHRRRAQDPARSP